MYLLDTNICIACIRRFKRF